MIPGAPGTLRKLCPDLRGQAVQIIAYDYTTVVN